MMNFSKPNFRKLTARNQQISADVEKCNQVADSWVTQAIGDSKRSDVEQVNQTLNIVIECGFLFGDCVYEFDFSPKPPAAHEDFIHTGSGMLIQRRK